MDKLRPVSVLNEFGVGVGERAAKATYEEAPSPKIIILTPSGP